jgi:hypothetical protein
MSAQELVDYLGRYFVIESLQEFNQSFHPLLDKQLGDADALRWVNGCESEPFDATSLIATVRKVTTVDTGAFAAKAVEYGASRASAAFQDLDLSPGFLGRMVDAGGTLSIDVPPGSVRCNLILWSHAWSGRARVRAGAEEVLVDLYSHVGGCRRVTLPDIAGCDTIVIESLGIGDSRSLADQVIFFRAVFATTTVEP